MRALIPTIFFAALLPRLLWIWEWTHSPFAIAPHLDAKSYMEWGQRIAQGEWLRENAFYQAPLYPYLIAALLKLPNMDATGIAIFQAALDSGTCVLLALLTLRIFGRSAAFATGLITALSPALIFFTAPLMKETLGLFLMATLLLVWQQARDSKMSPKGSVVREHLTALAGGLLLGLLALVRSNALLMGALIPWVYKPRRWPAVALGALIPLSLSLTHNYLASGDGVLISSTGGFNLYIGHSPEARGGGDYPHGISTDPQEEEIVTQKIAEAQLGRPLKPSEASAFWSRKALEFALENPLRELELLGEKFWRSVNDWEAPDNYDQNFMRREYSNFLNALPGRFGVIFIAAVFGLLASHYRGPSWRRSVPLWGALGIYLASLLIFYVTDRYRLPLYILLAPWAGFGIATACALASRRISTRSFCTKKRAATIGIALAASAALTWPRPTQNETSLEIYNLSLIATMYSHGGFDDEAIKTFERANAIDAKQISSEAYTRVGEAFERQGRLTQAEQSFRSGVSYHPGEPLPMHNLGRFLYTQRRYAEARDEFRKCLKLAPWTSQAWTGLAAAELSLGEVKSARHALNEARRLNPTSIYLAPIEAAIDAAARTNP